MSILLTDALALSIASPSLNYPPIGGLAQIEDIILL